MRHQSTFSKMIIPAIAVALILFGLSKSMSFGQSVQIVFGLWYVLFLPGFVWTFSIWKQDALPRVERIIMAVFLSMVIIPILVVLSNRLHLPIDNLWTFCIATLVTIVGIWVQRTQFYSLWFKKS